ncbi:MAG TPA: cache domain-containing protein [Burkholderiales bacterium]|nr:cache domain-containing protein [Burkholderiales bacterium]
MRTQWWPIIAFLGCLGWIAGAGATDDDCSNATPAEAKTLAHKAAEQLERLGPEKAFPEFMDPSGDFFPRDLYVFVVDLDGRMWVNGAFPQAIGSNALTAQDNRGRRYIEEMLNIARARGEGQIEYLWVNPCTSEYTDKLTFFKRVGRFVVAVGAYRAKTTQSARISAPVSGAKLEIG